MEIIKELNKEAWDINAIEKALKAPFKSSEIEWRVQSSGEGKTGQPWALVLAYVDARAIMNRLDEVLGVNAWEDEYTHVEQGKEVGVICRLRCRIGDTIVTKMDGSPETDIESFKGGFSKAFVRTAVKYGIGRYLYNLSTTFADTSVEKPADDTGWKKDKLKSGQWYWWKIPTLPPEFLPVDEQPLSFRLPKDVQTYLLKKFGKDKDAWITWCNACEWKHETMRKEMEDMK